MNQKIKNYSEQFFSGKWIDVNMKINYKLKTIKEKVFKSIEIIDYFILSP